MGWLSVAALQGAKEDLDDLTLIKVQLQSAENSTVATMFTFYALANQRGSATQSGVHSIQPIVAKKKPKQTRIHLKRYKGSQRHIPIRCFHATASLFRDCKCKETVEAPSANNPLARAPN